MDPLSDNVQIANAITNLVGAMFAAYITYLIARLNKKTGHALEIAEEVRSAQGERQVAGDLRMDSLVTIAESTKQTGEAVHTLVNSKMLNQLQISAVALRRLAAMTGHPDDERAAILAEVAYREQRDRQDNLDRARPDPGP